MSFSGLPLYKKRSAVLIDPTLVSLAPWLLAMSLRVACEEREGGQDFEQMRKESGRRWNRRSNNAQHRRLCGARAHLYASPGRAATRSLIERRFQLTKQAIVLAQFDQACRPRYRNAKAHSSSRREAEKGRVGQSAIAARTRLLCVAHVLIFSMGTFTQTLLA